MFMIPSTLSAAASLVDANMQAGQYKADAATAKHNAGNLETQARQVGAVAARNEEQARREYRQFAGSQFAQIAESGLTSEGSMLDLVRDSETNAYLDALNIRHQGETESRSLLESAKQERYKSRMASKMASRAKWSGVLAAAGQLGSGYMNRPKTTPAPKASGFVGPR